MMRELLEQAVREALGGEVDVVPITTDEAKMLDHTQLVVMDLDLGTGVDTPSLIEVLAARGIGTVLVSAAGTPEEIQGCLRAGALSFVAKGSGLAALPRALSDALVGRRYLTRELAGKLVRPALPGMSLSPEQQRALSLRAAGVQFESIANALGRTTADVRGLLDGAVAAYRGTA